MTEDRKPAYKFSTNIPLKCELNFDICKVGESKYGPWYMYGVKNLETGEDVIFFAAEGLHKQLATYRKGKQLVITRCEGEENKKFFKIEDYDPQLSGSSPQTQSETNGLQLSGHELQVLETIKKEKPYILQYKAFEEFYHLFEFNGFKDRTRVKAIFDEVTQ